MTSSTILKVESDHSVAYANWKTALTNVMGETVQIIKIEQNYEVPDCSNQKEVPSQTPESKTKSAAEVLVNVSNITFNAKPEIDAIKIEVTDINSETEEFKTTNSDLGMSSNWKHLPGESSMLARSEAELVERQNLPSKSKSCSESQELLQPKRRQYKKRKQASVHPTLPVPIKPKIASGVSKPSLCLSSSNRNVLPVLPKSSSKDHQLQLRNTPQISTIAAATATYLTSSVQSQTQKLNGCLQNPLVLQICGSQMVPNLKIPQNQIGHNSPGQPTSVILPQSFNMPTTIQMHGEPVVQSLSLIPQIQNLSNQFVQSIPMNTRQNPNNQIVQTAVNPVLNQIHSNNQIVKSNCLNSVPFQFSSDQFVQTISLNPLVFHIPNSQPVQTDTLNSVPFEIPSSHFVQVSSLNQGLKPYPSNQSMQDNQQNVIKLHDAANLPIHICHQNPNPVQFSPNCPVKVISQNPVEMHVQPIEVTQSCPQNPKQVRVSSEQSARLNVQYSCLSLGPSNQPLAKTQEKSAVCLKTSSRLVDISKFALESHSSCGVMPKILSNNRCLTIATQNVQENLSSIRKKKLSRTGKKNLVKRSNISVPSRPRSLQPKPPVSTNIFQIQPTCHGCINPSENQLQLQFTSNMINSDLMERPVVLQASANQLGELQSGKVSSNFGTFIHGSSEVKDQESVRTIMNLHLPSSSSVTSNPYPTGLYSLQAGRQDVMKHKWKRQARRLSKYSLKRGRLSCSKKCKTKSDSHRVLAKSNAAAGSPPNLSQPTRAVVSSYKTIVPKSTLQTVNLMLYPCEQRVNVSSSLKTEIHRKRSETPIAAADRASNLRFIQTSSMHMPVNYEQHMIMSSKSSPKTAYIPILPRPKENKCSLFNQTAKSVTWGTLKKWRKTVRKCTKFLPQRPSSHSIVHINQKSTTFLPTAFSSLESHGSETSVPVKQASISHQDFKLTCKCFVQLQRLNIDSSGRYRITENNIILKVPKQENEDTKYCK